MGEVSDGLTAILAIVETQQRSIARLVERLDLAALDRTLPLAEKVAAEPPAELVNWMEISGPERLEAWRGLVSFVDTIVEYYCLQLAIRPCWWQHVDAVEELTALWMYRQHCYSDPKNLDGAMNWTDTLSRSLGRLRDIFISCRDIHVDARIAGTWMRDDVRQALYRMIEADVSGHPASPGAQNNRS